MENNLCYRLGSLNDTCVMYINNEGPEVMKMLENLVVSIEKKINIK